MIALYIILGIAAFILLVALTRVTVAVVSDDGSRIYLKILFIKILLAPKEEKTPDLRDFKIKKYRKRRLKEEKKLLKAEKKKQKKETKNEKSDSGEKKKTETDTGGASLGDNVTYGTDIIRNVVAKAVEKFGKHARITVRKLHITVAGSEPDKTAITYGYVCQAVAYILEIANCNLNMVYPKRKQQYIAVNVDFLAEKPTFEADIAIGLRVWQIISVGVTALKGYIFDVDKPAPKTKTEENEKEKVSVTDKNKSEENKDGR